MGDVITVTCMFFGNKYIQSLKLSTTSQGYYNAVEGLYGVLPPLILPCIPSIRTPKAPLYSLVPIKIHGLSSACLGYGAFTSLFAWWNPTRLAIDFRAGFTVQRFLQTYKNSA